MITVALVAAQRRDDDLRKHIRGVRYQGISEQQILEILIHVSTRYGARPLRVTLAVVSDLRGLSHHLFRMFDLPRACLARIHPDAR